MLSAMYRSYSNQDVRRGEPHPLAPPQSHGNTRLPSLSSLLAYTQHQLAPMDPLDQSHALPAHSQGLSHHHRSAPLLPIVHQPGLVHEGSIYSTSAQHLYHYQPRPSTLDWSNHTSGHHSGPPTIAVANVDSGRVEPHSDSASGGLDHHPAIASSSSHELVYDHRGVLESNWPSIYDHIERAGSSSSEHGSGSAPASATNGPTVASTSMSGGTDGNRFSSVRDISLQRTSKRSQRDVASDDETGDGRKKRKRRRKQSETPRDAALRKYPCDICGKSFARPSARTLHVRSHTKSKPFSCKYEGCDCAFAVIANLRRHRRVYNHHTVGDDDEEDSPLAGGSGARRPESRTNSVEDDQGEETATTPMPPLQFPSSINPTLNGHEEWENEDHFKAEDETKKEEED